MAFPACIGVRSKMVDHYTPPLAGENGKYSVGLAVSMTFVTDKWKESAPPEMREAWAQCQLSAYSRSGIFSDVVRDSSNTDFRAEIYIDNTGKGRPFIVGLLAALTLNLIPTTSWEQYEISTVFKDTSGKTVGAYVKEERVTVWYQTFLLFGIPFAAFGNVVEEACYDLAYATLEEARSAGIFSASTQTNSP